MRKRTKVSRSSAVGLAAMAALCANGVAMANCEPAWDENVGNPGLSGGDAGVWSFATFDTGNGDVLYAAGGFINPGNRVVRWERGQWDDVGFDLSNTGRINDMAVFDGHLYVGDTNGVEGRFARYDGQTWEEAGDGVFNTVGTWEVWSLAVYDDGNGPALYVAGRFNRAGGQSGLEVSNIARWDGERWDDVGGGLGSSSGVDLVQSMIVWDGSLYASGRFTTAGGTPVQNLARWDGSDWHDVGGGLDGGFLASINDMAIWDDGSGEALYLTGNDMTSGDVTSNVIRWDGQEFSAPGGSGPNGFGRSLAVYDDGDGEKLYVVGGVLGMPMHMASRWDGSTWEEIPDQLVRGGAAMTSLVFDDGEGEALFIGGSFERTASGIASSYVAAWRGCPVCIADWNGDGEVDINDFFAYLSDFEDGDPRADLNNDGEIDINDFFIFLQEFEEGC